MRILFAAVVPLMLAGCTEPAPLPLGGPLVRAADPALTQPAPSGPAVAFTARPITEPQDWRRLNDAQAPGGSS